VESSGFVILRTDNDGPQFSPGAASATAVARMRHRPVVSVESTLVAGKTYLVVPLSLHTGVHREVTLTCRSSKSISMETLTLDAKAIQSAWVAYARYRAPDEQNVVEVVQDGGTLVATQGLGACVVALAQNTGSSYMRLNLGIVASDMRFTRGVANSVDWVRPGFAQLVQIALPKDEAVVAWAAAPALTIVEAGPMASPRHVPEIEKRGVGALLHRPFRICEVEPAPKLPESDDPPTCPSSKTAAMPGAQLHEHHQAVRQLVSEHGNFLGLGERREGSRVAKMVPL